MNSIQNQINSVATSGTKAITPQSQKKPKPSKQKLSKSNKPSRIEKTDPVVAAKGQVSSSYKGPRGLNKGKIGKPESNWNSRPKVKGHDKGKPESNWNSRPKVKGRDKGKGHGKFHSPKKAPKLSRPKGTIYIQSTQNNTIVTLTDLKGNAKSWASGGSCGFNGSRRCTTFAAKAAAEKVAKDAISIGWKFINVQMKGLGRGKKKSAVKGVQHAGVKILKIQDTTSVPHNGCRAPKKRRT